MKLPSERDVDEVMKVAPLVVGPLRNWLRSLRGHETNRRRNP